MALVPPGITALATLTSQLRERDSEKAAEAKFGAAKAKNMGAEAQA